LPDLPLLREFYMLDRPDDETQQVDWLSGAALMCRREALWQAGLSPRRAAGTLVARDGRPTARLERLVAAIRAVVADAIEAGGSTLRDHVGADGELGRFQHRFSAYKREHAPCPRPGCRGTVRRIVQSGRSTFFCPECQR
jgi:formamidopyrimidine-DNA glycosylase